ncbi:MAG: hypothetical protein INH41_20675, partial [Myxococcaceae bacterium]|nr:hypothetical protein [Myxococcaceae bacterium]
VVLREALRVVLREALRVVLREALRVVLLADQLVEWAAAPRQRHPSSR